MAMQREKVAILGGGLGAIATAWELTATRALRERYEVTVYQPGWRLGGKGASGRNRDAADRIEEHGLHVFFGFYDNAFDVMKACYDELGRSPDQPLATWKEAFTKSPEIVLCDEWEGTWTNHPLILPENDLEPGSGDLFSLHEKFDEFVEWVERELVRVLGDLGEIAEDAVMLLPDLLTELPVVGPLFKKAEKAIRDALHVGGLVHDAEVLTVEELFANVRHQSSLAATRQGFVELAPELTNTLRALRDAVWVGYAKDRLDNADVRFAFMALDLGVTMVSGILADDLLRVGFSEVNDEELRDWFTRNGARPETVQHSPVLRALYDLTFAFEDGDTTKGNLAAGKALQALLRIGLTYKGAVTWKMNAGMGDVIFAPLYEVLDRRGVTFKFFHWVTDIGVHPEHDRVETFDVVAQVDLGDGGYDPLFDVKGLPCWPSAPLWERIPDGDAVKEMLAESGVTFENTANPLDRPVRTLTHGVDFDTVVLGISPGGLGPICSQLRERSKPFDLMMENTFTVATQAFQVWTQDTPAQLGWTASRESIAGSYVEPLDTYCDQTHLLERENWPSDLDVNGLGYFCGPLQVPAGSTQKQADQQVSDAAVSFLETDVGELWPSSVKSGKFDWNQLADPADQVGSARFGSQYWRANIQGTELYVQTRAGTVQYRLGADESGFDNLLLAGDWTRNGIDGGSAEAAIASGRLAARAISGRPVLVPGEHGVLAEDVGAGAPPRYVEYGGYQSFPGPYECKDTTLWSFIATADLDRLRDVVDKMFTQPTLGQRRYRPLGPYVMITWGDIKSIHPAQPPWSTIGDLTEPQVAVWVPVVEVTGTGTRQKAHRFWFCNPYIWLDNPYSIASGREIYGWPKTLGWPTFPDDQTNKCTLDVFGMDFSSTSRPDRHPLLEVDVVPPDRGTDPAFTDLSALANYLVGAIGDRHELGFVDPDLDVDLQLAIDAVEASLPVIFLKQFRSIENGTTASSQQITETLCAVQKIRGWPMLEEHQLTVHSLDSEPVLSELGLDSQKILVSFVVDMDFRVQDGHVIWNAG